MPKLTTWTLTNAVPTVNPKATKATDNALTVTADSIVKNGKPADGKTINLTIAHLRTMRANNPVMKDGKPETDADGKPVTVANPLYIAGSKFQYDEATRTVTIVRAEGSRGRKPRKATAKATISDFIANL